MQLRLTIFYIQNINKQLRCQNKNKGPISYNANTTKGTKAKLSTLSNMLILPMKTVYCSIQPYMAETKFWLNFGPLYQRKMSNNNKQSLSPKILGSAIDPQRISQGWPYIIFLHSTLSIVILFATPLIAMSFFITYTNVIFWTSSTFFRSLNLDQLTLSYRSISHSPLYMTKPSYVTKNKINQRYVTQTTKL